MWSFPIVRDRRVRDGIALRCDDHDLRRGAADLREGAAERVERLLRLRAGDAERVVRALVEQHSATTEGERIATTIRIADPSDDARAIPAASTYTVAYGRPRKSNVYLCAKSNVGSA